jgi:hypothetical protein
LAQNYACMDDSLTNTFTNSNSDELYALENERDKLAPEAVKEQEKTPPISQDVKQSLFISAPDNQIELDPKYLESFFKSPEMAMMINDQLDDDRPNCATPTPATPPTLRPVGRPMMPQGFYTQENDPVRLRQNQVNKYKMEHMPKTEVIHVDEFKTPPPAKNHPKNPLSIKLPNILNFNNSKNAKDKKRNNIQSSNNQPNSANQQQAPNSGLATSTSVTSEKVFFPGLKNIRKVKPKDAAPKTIDLEKNFEEVEDPNLPMDWNNVIGASNPNQQSNDNQPTQLDDLTPTSNITEITPSSASQIRPFFKRIRSALNVIVHK